MFPTLALAVHTFQSGLWPDRSEAEHIHRPAMRPHSADWLACGYVVSGGGVR